MAVLRPFLVIFLPTTQMSFTIKVQTVIWRCKTSKAGGSLSVMQFASSPRSNPFIAVYVKERLSPSTKNIVTEVLVIEFQLILCHNNILKVNGLTPLIGDRQSSIMSKVCQKKIQTRLAPQNDHLNLSFVKDFLCSWQKKRLEMVLIKTAIYLLQTWETV